MVYYKKLSTESILTSSNNRNCNLHLPSAFNVGVSMKEDCCIPFYHCFVSHPPLHHSSVTVKQKPFLTATFFSLDDFVLDINTESKCKI